MYMVDILSYLISGKKRITSTSMRDSIGRYIGYYTLFLVNQNYSVLYWDCTVNMHCSDIYLRQRIQDANIVHRYELPALKYYMYLWSVQDAWGELHAPYDLADAICICWMVCVYMCSIPQNSTGDSWYMGLVLSYTSVLYANQCSNYHNLLHYVFFPPKHNACSICPAPGFRTQSCYGHYTFLSPALQCATCPPADSACMGLPI